MNSDSRKNERGSIELSNNSRFPLLAESEKATDSLPVQRLRMSFRTNVRNLLRAGDAIRKDLSLALDMTAIRVSATAAMRLQHALPEGITNLAFLRVSSLTLNFSRRKSRRNDLLDGSAVPIARRPIDPMRDWRRFALARITRRHRCASSGRSRQPLRRRRSPSRRRRRCRIRPAR